MDPWLASFLQLLLPLIILGIGVIFVYRQYRLLQAIQPENRKIPAGQVWLQLIPFLGMFYQFFVINKISQSIAAELSAPAEDSIFSHEEVSGKPTFKLGIAYATLFCLCILPFPMIKGLFALAGMVVWIIYWTAIERYRKKIVIYHPQ